MTKVTCDGCGASFDVNFEPGFEFTCGACNGVVRVPEAAAEEAPRPRVAPAAPRPARPAPGRAAPARHAAPARSRPRDAEAAVAAPSSASKRNKLIMMVVVGATALLLGVLGFLAMTGEKGPPPAPPQPEPKPAEATTAKTPEAMADAQTPTDPEPPRRMRPTDPYEAARFDASQPGAGSLAKITFGDLAYERADALEAEGKRAESLLARKDALDSYKDVLKAEKNHERARERLGFVPYDRNEAQRLAAIPTLGRKLRATLQESIEVIEDRLKDKKVAFPVWMHVDEGAFADVAPDWRLARREALAKEALERAKKDDPFYERAARVAKATEGDVGPALKRKGLDGPVFDAYANKPMIVMALRDEQYDTQEVAEHWMDLLAQLRDTFRARFPALNLPPMDRPTPLLILRYNTDYTKYMRRDYDKGDRATPIVSQAHFEPGSKRLVVWKEVDRREKAKDSKVVTDEEVRTVLFHEGTHQLVDYYTKARASNLNEAMWFSEGLADYFGGHSRKWDQTAGRWRYEVGQINGERALQVGEIKKAGGLFKLRDLLDYRRNDYERDKFVDPVKTGTVYAQGWSLVYLLSNWDNNKYRAKFDEYVKKELNGESGPAAFEAVFGADKIDEIEKELHAMIDVLYTAAKEKRIIDGKVIDK